MLQQPSTKGVATSYGVPLFCTPNVPLTKVEVIAGSLINGIC